MKQTTTNRMEITSSVQSIMKNVLGLLMLLALSGISVTNAQQAKTHEVMPAEDQPFYNERNPGGGTVKGNTIVPPVAPTITSLTMLDMGFDKAILTWSTTAVFDSILFRYAPSGSGTTRIVAISGNPNPERYYLLGLLSQTSYDIEVSTIYNGSSSSWSAPLTVTTLAEPAPRFAQSNTNLLVINPNPVSTTTTISFMASSNTPQTVSIVSSTGRIMYRRTILPTTDKVQMIVDVSAYPSGIYMVRVNNNTNVSVERLIKL